MAYKLVCFDLDGVIFKDINFWMQLHKIFGTETEGKLLTEKYLHTDYAKLVQEVVGRLWKGKDARPYYDLIKSIEYIQGAPATLKLIHKSGYKTAIISASSLDLAKRAQKDLGFNFIFGNDLIIRDGMVSGDFSWPVGAGKNAKARIMRELCASLSITTQEVIFIGDSDTDIEALKESGLAIAFNPTSDQVRAAADYIVISANLASILKYIPLLQ
jgi:phosphoserine phosphatase